MNKIYIGSDKEVPDALDILEKESKNEKLVSCDTETNGFDGYTNKLWSVQLGTRNDSFLFPYYALNNKSKDLLRQFLVDKTMIAHNAKFDYKFLVLNGFKIGDTYCTQEIEHILFAGKYFTFGLKDVLLRRFQIQMSKEVRKDFYDGTFDNEMKKYGKFGIWEHRPDLIEYALKDIVHLHEVFDDQQRDLKELGMEDLMWLENTLVPVVGRMENRGVGLDIAATKKFESKVTQRRDELSKELFTTLESSFNIRYQRAYAEKMKLWDVWQLEHDKIKAQNNTRDPNDKRKKLQSAKDAIAESNKNKPFRNKPVQNKKFSPTSSIALRDALSEFMGFEISTTNKEWLEENTHLHQAIADLVEFRKFEKLVQFCALKDELNKETGLIHASFWQNGTKSGRFSCSDPNLQQIPARSDEAKEFRALFRPKKGFKFIGADLAGIELVILAYYSEEEGLLEAINTGKDVHCYTMSILLNCPYEVLIKAKNGEELDFTERVKFDSALDAFHKGFTMIELEKVIDNPTSWVKKFRDYVKTLTYGMAYGLTSWGLSKKFHCSQDDAQLFIKRFFGVYGKLKKFLEEEEELGYTRKYAVNPTGRRRWFMPPRMKTYEEVEKEVIKAFDKDKRLWDSISDDEWDKTITQALKDAKKEYQGKIGYIKRQAGNFFPQSMNADIIKLAMIKFDRDFESNEEEGLIITVHDELIATAKDEHSEHCAEVLEDSMEYAVHKFMPEIIQHVKAEISDYWKK